MGVKKDFRSLQLSTEDIAEAAAAAPALLLCAATLIMLLLDIALPSMKDAQYVVYPVLIKITGLLGMVCAAACFRYDLYTERLRLDAASVLFMLFMGCVVISTCINGLTQDVLFGVRYRYIGIFDLAVCFTVYMYCSSRIRRESLKRLILTVLTAVSDAVAAAFLFNEFLGGIPAFQGRMEPGGMFFHGNHYGYFLVICLTISVCLMLYEDGRLMCFGIFSVLLNTAALIVCRSMGAVLSCCAAVLLVIICVLRRGSRSEKKKVLILAVIFAAAAAAALSFSGKFRYDIGKVFDESSELLSGTNNIHAGNGRWGLWQFTLIYISEKPFFGFGCEGITERLYELTKVPNPHNEILTYAAYFGIPAALMYTGGVLLKLLRSLKPADTSKAGAAAAFAALAYFISSMFGVAMFYTAPLFFVMLGMANAGYSDGIKE